MRKSLLLAALTLLPLCALADFAGVWTASFETQVGVQNYTYTFKVDDTKLTGTAKSDNGEVEIADGKVEGDKITFVENLDYQGMPLVITYTGTLNDEGEIEFSRDVAGIATETFKAVPKKE
jgi:hypothetical protein